MNGLIEDIKQGDRAAFRELFEDYYPILCVFAMKYIRDEEQCKDVAQETLLTYWQNRADFEDIFKVKGYLYRVARNRCLNMIRREQVDEHFVKEALTESEAYFENEVIRQETYLLVQNAVDKLPPQMRRIIRYSLEGLNNPQIAKEMGIGEGTVKSLKQTAYRKLKDQLKEYFYLLLFL